MRRLVVLVVALAGCLTPTVDEAAPSAQAPDLSVVYDLAHDHADAALHDVRWNFTQVAYHSLTEDGAPLGIAAEIDVAGDLAAVHYEGARSGFVLVDVADVKAPKLLSWADAEIARPFEGRDVKLDPSGEYAYFALQIGAATDTSQARTSEASGGFLVFDVRDTAAPKLVAQGREPGRGCHMIRYWESGETRVVYCASTGGLVIFQLVDGAAGPRTPVRIGVVAASEPEGHLASAQERILPERDPQALAGNALVSVQPHDMTAQLDPVSGEAILVAAYEYHGVRVWSIAEDPTRPTLLSVWTGEGATRWGRVHTALVAPIGEKRVLVAVEEASGDHATGFWVVDATDWAAPTIVAEWETPGGATSGPGALLSTHNIQLVGTTLYMAHFHGGVWAFDVSDPARPKEIALWSGRAAGTSPETPGSIWDVVVKDGHVLASDMASGLFVLHHEGDPAGDPAWRSFV